MRVSQATIRNQNDVLGEPILPQDNTPDLPEPVPPEPNFPAEVQELRNEGALLRTELKDLKLTEEGFQNPDKVKVYTGLQSLKTVQIVLDLIKPHMKERLLSQFQQLLLTLMRLRLNLPITYLGYVFNIHHTTVSRVFNDTINLLFCKLVPVTLFWPESNHITDNLPAAFKDKYPRCVSIIDCFEIFIERPSSLDSRASTYSNYKSHNTAKYLISITPQGFINFISLGWGGRTSDRHITENCGYLNQLRPGDMILADRGFNIADVVALSQATLHIPSFTKGKPQLSADEVEQTRGIASVRIHVERVIGMLRRKYSFLSGTVPISMLQLDTTTNVTSLDKIVKVSAALCNLCEVIVNF